MALRNGRLSVRLLCGLSRHSRGPAPGVRLRTGTVVLLARRSAGTHAFARTGADHDYSIDPVVEDAFTDKRSQGTVTMRLAQSFYLLEEVDFQPLKTVKVEGRTEYLTEDVERVCLQRFGTKANFLEERRRRKTLPHSRCSTNQSQSPSGLRAVYTAVATNTVICAVKFGVYLYTGSDSLLSEAVHSLADVANQGLLIVGIRAAARRPESLFPYGFSSERYIWSLISGVGIFFLGCGVAVQNGIDSLMHPHPVTAPYAALGILGISLAMEGYSMFIACSEIRSEAQRTGLTFREYLLRGSDPVNVAVFTEDGVALAGVAVAGGGVAAALATGNDAFDAAGSIGVGLLMGAAAVFLIRKSRLALNGMAMDLRKTDAIKAALLADPIVESISNVKCVVLGVDNSRFSADISFNARALAERCLAMHTPLKEYKAALSPAAGKQLSDDAVEEVLCQHTQAMVTVIGHETDRLERLVHRIAPEVRWVDLEVL